MLKFAAEGYGSTESMTASKAALEALEAASAKASEEGDALVAAEGELRTVQADLLALEKGEEGIKKEIEILKDDVEYKDSQIEFYDDGVTAVQRLYDMFMETFKQNQRTKDEALLARTRARTMSNSKQTNVDGLLDDIEAAKLELARMKQEWETSEGEVQLLMEKQKNVTNEYFGSIRNDFEALREYRKYKYFCEMITRLRQQLADEGKKCKEYSPAMLYAAVLKNKIDLKNWVDFSREQFLREGGDTGTPMEPNAQFKKVEQMLDFLRERAKLVEGRTWPSVDA